MFIFWFLVYFLGMAFTAAVVEADLDDWREWARLAFWWVFWLLILPGAILWILAQRRRKVRP
jgi:hypothetical protein